MNNENSNLCFVIMPIGEDGTDAHANHLDTFNNIIKPAVERSGCGLYCRRADDLNKSGSVLNDIIRDLKNARLVIADLSDLNPNVMWELGVRHTFTQGTILIAKKGTKLPFDTKFERTKFFSKTTDVDIERSIGEIALAISETLNAETLDDSPVFRVNSSSGSQLNKEFFMSKILASLELDDFVTISTKEIEVDKFFVYCDASSPSRVITQLILVYKECVFDSGSYVFYSDIRRGIREFMSKVMEVNFDTPSFEFSIIVPYFGTLENKNEFQTKLEISIQEMTHQSLRKLNSSDSLSIEIAMGRAPVKVLDARDLSEIEKEIEILS